MKLATALQAALGFATLVVAAPAPLNERRDLFEHARRDNSQPPYPLPQSFGAPYPFESGYLLPSGFAYPTGNSIVPSGFPFPTGGVPSTPSSLSTGAPISSTVPATSIPTSALSRTSAAPSLNGTFPPSSSPGSAIATPPSSATAIVSTSTCSTNDNGRYFCNGPDLIGQCSNGRIVWGPVAVGMACEDGNYVAASWWPVPGYTTTTTSVEDAPTASAA